MLTITAPEQVAGLPWWPLVLLLAALIAFNVINNRLAPQGHYLLWAIGGSFGVLAIGLLDGNSWTDMGLGWGYLVPGFIWGVGCIVVVTAGYLIAASFRKGRNAMHDDALRFDRVVDETLAILAARAGGSSGGDLTQAAIMGSQAAMIQQQLNFSREAIVDDIGHGFVMDDYVMEKKL